MCDRSCCLLRRGGLLPLLCRTWPPWLLHILLSTEHTSLCRRQGLRFCGYGRPVRLPEGHQGSSRHKTRQGLCAQSEGMRARAWTTARLSGIVAVYSRATRAAKPKARRGFFARSEDKRRIVPCICTASAFMHFLQSTHGLVLLLRRSVPDYLSCNCILAISSITSRPRDLVANCISYDDCRSSSPADCFICRLQIQVFDSVADCTTSNGT